MCRTEAPGIERGFQSVICEEQRSCRAASWGVAVGSACWRSLVIVLERHQASDGPAACAVKAVKVIARASRRMSIGTGGGQLACDGIAAVAEVGLGRCRARHFLSAAVAAGSDAAAGKRPKASTRHPPQVRSDNR